MDEVLHIVLIEDEVKSLDLLTSLVNELEGVKLEASFTNPVEALHYLLENQPDLVLLDIRMPQLSGLELVEELRKKGIYFPFIFVTAHDEYILDALRQRAMDYLLKPVSRETLRNTIDQFREFDQQKLVQQVINGTTKPNPYLLKINVKSGFEVVDTTKIVCLIADGRYTIAILNDGKEITISQNLGCFDPLSKSHGYLRVHRSSIINPEYLRKLNRVNKVCLLESGEFQYKVKVSAQGISLLENYYEKL